jgi:hypothetical protein
VALQLTGRERCATVGIVMNKPVSLLLLLFVVGTPVFASDEEAQATPCLVQHRSPESSAFWNGSSFKYIPMFRRVPIPKSDHQIFRFPAELKEMKEKSIFLFRVNFPRIVPVLDKPIVPMGDYDQAVPVA